MPKYKEEPLPNYNVLIIKEQSVEGIDLVDILVAWQTISVQSMLRFYFTVFIETWEVDILLFRNCYPLSLCFLPISNNRLQSSKQYWKSETARETHTEISNQFEWTCNLKNVPISVCSQNILPVCFVSWSAGFCHSRCIYGWTIWGKASVDLTTHFISYLHGEVSFNGTMYLLMSFLPNLQRTYKMLRWSKSFEFYFVGSRILFIDDTNVFYWILIHFFNILPS